MPHRHQKRVAHTTTTTTTTTLPNLNIKMSSALCLTSTAAATAAVCVTAARPSKTAPSTPSLRRGRSVRARVATETGSTRVGDGVFDSDEVVRPLSAAQKDVLLQSLAADLENQYAEGFTYTPFSAGMTFADPVVILEGRTPYKLMMGPTWFTVNQVPPGTPNPKTDP